MSFFKNLSQIPNKIDIYPTSLETEIGNYELKIQLKDNKIYLTCNSEIDYLSLYSYSKEYTFEELIGLSNCFKACNNLQNAFETLLNLIKGISIKLNNNYYDSEMKLKVLSDEFFFFAF